VRSYSLKVSIERCRDTLFCARCAGTHHLIFKRWDLWLLYLGGISGIYALWVLGTWAPAMFKEMDVKSLAQSSFYSSLLGISAIPGLSLAGFVRDRLARKGKGRNGWVL
jgi:sugar phosphate permease